MCDVIEKIFQADACDIDLLLDAVLQRYAALFPEWEMTTVSIEKSNDKNAQIDRMIRMLENLKISRT